MTEKLDIVSRKVKWIATIKKSDQSPHEFPFVERLEFQSGIKAIQFVIALQHFYPEYTAHLTSEILKPDYLSIVQDEPDHNYQPEAEPRA